ncbi:MAG TPA: rhodanese-like domain-containing protein [Puia sp.]|uniref:rhodanese-like domain-containing protein n=1 Tax=Puia sp. TaxID=2045100 RepID=UPI002B7A71D1|nr:rhodanese-like domain-containing protein [Puia sp.]HVU99051.1 rhodanese-like domain-containing protein [Puia sp.]
MSILFNRLFGKSDDLRDVYERGAIILDVRTPEEFRSGHVKGAVNIPLNLLEKNISHLRKENKPVITCCRSGARSDAARTMLEAAGIEVYNGGPWDFLNQKIQK